MVRAPGVSEPLRGGRAAFVGHRRQRRGGLLQVRRVVAVRAADHDVLAGLGRAHELDRVRAAHVAAGRLDRDGRDAEPGEDPLVRAAVQLEGLVQAGFVHVEAVGVLHRELADPQQAALGPRLVPELGLELIPELRQVPVGGQLGADRGEDLLVSHAQHDLGALAVPEPEHLLAHHVEPAALDPDRRGLHARQQHLLAADPVHLFPDRGHDLGPDPHGQRQQAVVTGHQLADEPGADQQPVAGGVRVRGILPEGGDVQLGPAHDGSTFS